MAVPKTTETILLIQDHTW